MDSSEGLDEIRPLFSNFYSCMLPSRPKVSRVKTHFFWSPQFLAVINPLLVTVILKRFLNARVFWLVKFEGKCFRSRESDSNQDFYTLYTNDLSITVKREVWVEQEFGILAKCSTQKRVLPTRNLLWGIQKLEFPVCFMFITATYKHAVMSRVVLNVLLIRFNHLFREETFNVFVVLKVCC